jgi:CheY-like chemotaxis protein
MQSENSINIHELIEKAKGISILYAEDEKELREKTAIFLNKIFTDVDVAADGKEALDKYLLRNYDIVITDIQMPNMNGLV